ncbi:hypothetical protein Tco_0578495 [Tanacetum coccineum]
MIQRCNYECLHLLLLQPCRLIIEIQQMAALLEDKMNIRMSRLEKAISEKNATTLAAVKAVKEVCVTCGSNHNFNNCPLTRNDFPVFQDNIHQFQQTAAVGNFVQRNPPNLANQMRPPGFNQPNVQSNQTNQNRYQGNNFNSNQNRGNNFSQNHQNNQGQVFQPPTNQPPVYQVPPFQASMPQIHGVSKTDFENYVKANDAGVDNVKNQAVKIAKNKAIYEFGVDQNIHIWRICHMSHYPDEEDPYFMEIPKLKLKKTVNVEIQDLNSPRPNSFTSKLPYPERMKVREDDKPSAQHSRFLKMFKQLRLEIGLKDALCRNAKVKQMVKVVCKEQRKLEEIAITTVEC